VLATNIVIALYVWSAFAEDADGAQVAQHALLASQLRVGGCDSAAPAAAPAVAALPPPPPPPAGDAPAPAAAARRRPRRDG